MANNTSNTTNNKNNKASEESNIDNTRKDNFSKNNFTENDSEDIKRPFGDSQTENTEENNEDDSNNQDSNSGSSSTTSSTISLVGLWSTTCNNVQMADGLNADGTYNYHYEDVTCYINLLSNGKCQIYNKYDSDNNATWSATSSTLTLTSTFYTSPPTFPIIVYNTEPLTMKIKKAPVVVGSYTGYILPFLYVTEDNIWTKH